MRVEVAARKTASVFVGIVSWAWLVVALALPVSGAATIGALTYTACVQVLLFYAWARRPPLALVIPALAVGTSSFLLGTLGNGNMPRDVAALQMVSLMLLALVHLRHSPRLALPSLLVLTAALVLAAVPLGLSDAALQLVLPPIAATAGLAIALPGMEAADRRVERARREVARAAVETAAQQARLTAHRAVQRTLHDEVLPALRSVATPSVARDGARQEAAHALARLEDTEHRAADLDRQTYAEDVPLLSLTTALTALGREVEPIRVASVADLDGPVDLPVEVTHALTGAAAEAIRNVQRHAGVAEVDLTVEADPEHVRVTLRDRGRGFDPRRTPESFGMRHSVRERMAEVGGAARVTSAPGRGTSVELTWRLADWLALERREDTEVPARHLTSSLTDPRWGATGVLLSFALMALGQGLFAIESLEQSWVWMVWALSLVAFGGITIWRGERHAHLATHVALQVLAALGLLAFVTTADPGDVTSVLAWPVSLAALAPGVTAALRSGILAPIAATVMCLGVAVLLITGALHEGDAALLIRATPSILSTLWPAVLGTVLRHILLTMGAERDREQAQLAAEHAREASAARRTEDIRARTRHIHPLLEPTLGAIARGELDLSDPRVRSEADVLERTVRDELHFPFGLTSDVAHAIREAREAGTEVVLATTSDLLRAPDAAGPLLRSALRVEPRPLRVTLSVSPQGAEVTLAAQVAPSADGAALAEVLRTHSAEVRIVADTVIARI